MLLLTLWYISHRIFKLLDCIGIWTLDDVDFITNIVWCHDESFTTLQTFDPFRHQTIAVTNINTKPIQQCMCHSRLLPIRCENQFRLTGQATKKLGMYPPFFFFSFCFYRVSLDMLYFKKKEKKLSLVQLYEGCSNINASSFITSFTYKIQKKMSTFLERTICCL